MIRFGDLKITLTGRARGIYLLMAGTTFPQCSRMQHGTISVTYKDDTSATLMLRNPETWWPIEQDYLLDDYLFVNEAPSHHVSTCVQGRPGFSIR